MTEKQIALVQDSFAKVAPISAVAADIFYNRLFEIDPTLKPLFKTDIKEQGKKLMSMIGIAVKGLNNLDALIPAVQDLGKRHVGYGVTSDHYDTVADALLYTLEKGLGENWTPDVKDAWLETYTVLSNTMKEAAYAKAG
mgnify:CR=1 FL=1